MKRLQVLAAIAMLAIVVLFPEVLPAASSEDGHGGGNQLVDLGWRVLNFIVFAVIIYVAAAKPARHFLNGRIEEIKGQLDEAERAKEEAEKKVKDISKKIENLAAEAAEMEETLKKEGEVERDRIIEAANLAAEKIKVQAEFTVEQELKKAIAAIREETAGAALEVAEKMLKEKVKPTDQKKLVEDYMGSLRGLN